MRLNPAQAVRNARRRRSDRAFMKAAWGDHYIRGFVYASIEYYLAATYGPRCKPPPLCHIEQMYLAGATRSKIDPSCACCVAWELYDEWRQGHKAQS